jgi:hypothetical protein
MSFGALLDRAIVTNFLNGISSSTAETIGRRAGQKPGSRLLEMRFLLPFTSSPTPNSRRSIQSPVPEGQEPALAEAILASGGEVVLICWEHDRIPALGQAIPTVDGTTIPTVWPGDRFDVIWTFALDPATGRYVFGQVPQQLLDGDTDTVI